MSDLASADDLAAFLGLSESEAETDSDLLTTLVDGAVALFEGQCGRAMAPFQDAEDGRIEIVDGRRSAKLWLDYPIDDVTAIAIGLDVATPTTTLNPDDATKVVWRAGTRLVTRTDGGSWHAGCPSYVKITYDAQADLPADAKLAVLQLAGMLYQRSGTEATRSETLDNYSVTFAQAASELPAWTLAVQHHRRLIAA